MKQSARGKKVEEMFRGTQVGLMIEHFEDQLQMLAEDLSGFRKETRERLKELEKNSNKTLEYLFAVGDRLDYIETELKQIKAELKKINESNVDKNEFKALKTKIQEIEKELKQIAEWQKNQQKLNFA
jgi:hypothetical protein